MVDLHALQVRLWDPRFLILLIARLAAQIWLRKTFFLKLLLACLRVRVRSASNLVHLFYFDDLWCAYRHVALRSCPAGSVWLDQMRHRTLVLLCWMLHVVVHVVWFLVVTRLGGKIHSVEPFGLAADELCCHTKRGRSVAVLAALAHEVALTRKTATAARSHVKAGQHEVIHLFLRRGSQLVVWGHRWYWTTWRDALCTIPVTLGLVWVALIWWDLHSRALCLLTYEA